MLAGGGKTGTQRFLRTPRSARRLFRLGRDRVEFERCCLTRRRGETRGEHLFRIGFRACKATQESQNLRARRQRRSYGFAARLTLGWKADQRSARRIPQLVWCISMLAGGGKTWTQYKISANFPLRPAYILSWRHLHPTSVMRSAPCAAIRHSPRLPSPRSRWGSA